MVYTGIKQFLQGRKMFVLVADSQAVFQKMIAHIFDEQGVEYQFCNTGAEVIEALNVRKVDLFVLAMNLPDMNGASLCQCIRKTINDDCIPIIVLTSDTSDQSFAEAFDAGATDIFRRNKIQYFSDYILHLTQAIQPLYARALILEDSRSQRLALESTLLNWGLSVDTFSSAKPAFEAHLSTPYDIILTDIELSGLENGLDFVHDVREQGLGCGDVPIIAITAYLSESTRVNFLARGIDRCMLKPLLMPELRSEIKKQIDARQVRLTLDRERKLEAEKNKAKSDFLARMSHELRTSLNAIIGFSDLLSFGDQHSHETKDYAGKINEAGKLLLNLINEVLDLSRIESGTVDLRVEVANISVMLEKCHQVMHNFADKYQIHLLFNEVDDTVNVYCDQTRLLEVLFNLISNAIKYNQEGGRVTVSVDVTKTDKIRISVVDDGIGISPQHLERIFEPFARVHDKSHGVQGTGIGLPIALHLMELMDGDLGFSSEKGEGSNFWLDIPRATNGSGVRRQTEVMLELDGLTPCSVVYVDDNPVNRLLIEKWFSRQAGTEILIADNAKNALELVLEHRPDVLITDIHMPGENGYWLLERVREKNILDEVPVIALSAMAMNDEVERGRQYGFDAYVTKPINFSELTRTLNTVLE